MENLQKLRAIGLETIAQAESLLFNCATNRTPQSQVARLYTLSIFEQFHATMCLFDNNAISHTPCLIRCMLEYLVDLVNTIHDPSYVDQLRKENALSDRKAIEAYATSLIGADLDSNMAKNLSTLREELGARERVEREQRRSNKIKKTDEIELPALYAILCGLTHPNLTSLAIRHSAGDKIAYRHPPEIDVQRMLLSIAIRLLTLTISHIPKFTDQAPGAVTALVDWANTQNIELQNQDTPA